MKFLFPILLFSTLTLTAQEIEWQKSLGGTDEEYGRSICQTSDGGSVVASRTRSNDGDVSGLQGLDDFWVVKLDISGNIQWQKCLGGTGWETPRDIHQTSDGGFIVAGETVSNDGDVSGNHGGLDFWVVKLDGTGNIQWQKCLGGTAEEIPYSIKQTIDGGYVVAGYTNSNDGDVSGHHNNRDYWIVKLDGIGNIQWQKCLGGFNHDDAYSIQQVQDGSFIVVGYTNSNDGDVSGQYGGGDGWVVKLDIAGNLQWQKCLGGTDGDYFKSVLQSGDGGYMLAGHTRSNDIDVSGNHGFVDFWVVKLDSAGTIQWQKCLGGTSEEAANSIQPTIDGGYIVAGETYSNDGDVSGNHGLTDYWVAKLDSTGNIQWQKCLGGTTNESALSVQQTADGDFVVAGYTGSNDGDVAGMHGLADVWVVKITNQYNLITGNVFLDLNSNNLPNVSEPFVPNILVTEVNTGRIGFSDSNGNYKVSVLDSGNYTNVADNLNYYTSVPQTHSVYFNSILQTDSLNDFALQPMGMYNDLCVNITPLTPFREGIDATYSIDFINTGTTTINNCTIIFFPHSSISYVSSNTTPFSVTPDSVIWNIGTLTPYQSGSITVTVNVNLGTPIGSTIYSGARIEPVAGDINPACNTNFIEVFTTGSYDPNDILVNRDTIFTSELPSPPYLDYIIRFQNTGNDTAFTVKVLNNITDKLEINSFEWVSSSHPVSTTYGPHSRLLTFTFNDILLPDSNTNEPESHGFVRYRIKPVSTLTAGDSIGNTAAIYFDFNAPVITNTAITEVVLPTGVNSYTTNSSWEVNLFPNPASNNLTISSNLLAEKNAVIKIYSIVGQLVLEKETHIINENHTQTIDINHLSDGMFFLTLQSGDITLQTKFVKQ